MPIPVIENWVQTTGTQGDVIAARSRHYDDRTELVIFLNGKKDAFSIMVFPPKETQ